MAVLFFGAGVDMVVNIFPTWLIFFGAGGDVAVIFFGAGGDVAVIFLFAARVLPGGN